MENTLPVVSPDVGLALQADILQREGNEYVVEVLRRLQEENPCIANFIASFSVNSKDPTATAYCGVMVYQLLKSQAEADELKRNLES